MRPKGPEEIRYIADITELFLSATNRYIEKGYISSAIINYTREQGQWQKSGRMDTRIDYEDEYKLTFDLEKEALVLSYKQRQLFSEFNPRTAEIKSREKAILEQSDSAIVIRDCKEADVRELMKLIREKAD